MYAVDTVTVQYRDHMTITLLSGDSSRQKPSGAMGDQKSHSGGAAAEGGHLHPPPSLHGKKGGSVGVIASVYIYIVFIIFHPFEDLYLYTTYIQCTSIY